MEKDCKAFCHKMVRIRLTRNLERFREVGYSPLIVEFFRNKPPTKCS